ncbi:Sucrose-6-phosphate hydrolase [Kluyvera cryocrescens]|uniref:Sucrose-6-phosphate hydrolase n=1 Tax=Kluyvera cryocrescens TaxID=580 RepID=A0A485B578_KLUCR|nr:Sucrose-6-phosphate hydrolase [Kluyvera cryocrescens]
MIGDWQPGQPFVPEGEFIEMDHGHDFYAPQSFLTPDGRRIVMGVAGYVGIADAGATRWLGGNALFTA